MKCFHCGDECKTEIISFQEKSFCCIGCKTVYEILHDNKLDTYYSLEDNPGYKIGKIQRKDQYDFLDNEEIKQRYLLFDDGNISKISFSIPQIHCSSCIWLLENLNRLSNGVILSVVNFPKRRADITFDNTILTLREVAELLSTIGYDPDLSASEKTESAKVKDRTLTYKIGVAGFCFGNIMLLSFPEYFGMDENFSGFKKFFGYASLVLSLPIFFYSGSDYIKSAFKGIQQRFINIDIPIALGMFTLFFRSIYEVLTSTGAGYFDSLSGLVFFLLLGKWFQQKTYDALSFDRDYKSYFPIAVNKIVEDERIPTNLDSLEIGDQIELRNQELIPSDSILMDGKAFIDYSFITGESEPIRKQLGDKLYAGGRQMGAKIKIELIKEVNNSYLTQLWNQEVFQKDDHIQDLNSIVNRISKHFTLVILLITALTGIYWWMIDPTMIWTSVTAVLIVACPCALALAVPFTFGNMTRVMGRMGLYLKNVKVIENMAEITDVVLDKTGTITNSDTMQLTYHGKELTETQKDHLHSLASNSTHPLSIAICHYLNRTANEKIDKFNEEAGLGISGLIQKKKYILGSLYFIQKSTTHKPNSEPEGSVVHASVDDYYLGYFHLQQQYRPGLLKVIKGLKRSHKIHLISGDNDSQKMLLKEEFGMENLHFNQSPMDKLSYIHKMQKAGKTVLMLGDGLNDAGALKQSNVGIAVSDNIHQFSPSCDAILDAKQFERMSDFIALSKKSIQIIHVSFVISFLYNLIGIGFAVTGRLSPVIAAILMPVSSISVVAFTTFFTNLLYRKKVK